MPIPTRWHRAPAAVLAGCVLMLSGCANAIEGKSISQTRNPYEVAGMPAVDGPSGPRPNAKPANRTVDLTDHGEVDGLAAAAVSDIEDFWSGEYPQTFWSKFHPVDRLISWDSRDPQPVHFCGQLIFDFENASYCIGDNSMGWDRGVLLPSLIHDVGPMAVPMVLAHEYGHAVARQAEMVDDNSPVLVSEQMADCLAGTYLRWVAQGSSPRFTLSTANGLNRVIAALISFRDPAGEGAQEAHGSAFDRVSALQRGFVEGAPSCTRIDAAEIAARRGNLPVNLAPGKSGQPPPVTAETLGSLMAVLKGVFGPTEPPRLSTAGAICADGGNGPRDNAQPAVYCPATNTVAVDLAQLTTLATAAGDRTRVIGDFTSYSIVISRYALAVQKQHDLALDTGQTALRSACLTGVALAAMAKDKTPDGQPNPMMLGAGDLDEAASGLLTNGIAASDLNGTTIPAGFSRIDAFRDGVAGSADRCLERYG